MQGMFKANGGCGYVKKPDFLLQMGPNDKIFTPNAQLDVKTVLTVDQFSPFIIASFGSFTMPIFHS